MTKNQFKDFCKKQGLSCSYSGNTKTMYVTGSNATQLLRHSSVAAKCNFKVTVK